jgi:hypothetical protein
LNQSDTEGIADPLKKADSRTPMNAVLGVFDFLAPGSPSTYADFGVLNFFFRTATPQLFDFSAKNHPIIQFKI